jgi:hypothetical protein
MCLKIFSFKICTSLFIKTVAINSAGGIFGDLAGIIHEALVSSCRVWFSSSALMQYLYARFVIFAFV